MTECQKFVDKILEVAPKRSPYYRLAEYAASELRNNAPNRQHLLKLIEKVELGQGQYGDYYIMARIAHNEIKSRQPQPSFDWAFN